MRLIHVLPIMRGVTRSALTYFTNDDIVEGALVSVPIRKKSVPAFVYKVEDTSAAKAKIKSAEYKIKKIDKKAPATVFLPEFITAIFQTADYFAGSPGAVFDSLLPKTVFVNPEKLAEPNFAQKPKQIAYEKLLIQGGDEARYLEYKGLIRTAFAKGYSVFFCVPATIDIEKAQTAFAKGIEEYTVGLHAALPKKELFSRINTVISTNHPMLIIATGSFLWLPRKDLGYIVIERSESRAYIQLTRPYISIPRAANYLAKAMNIRIVFGDIFLGTEKLFWYDEHDCAEYAPISLRTLSPARTKIVDMRKTPDDKNTKRKKKEPFLLLSDELKKILARVKKEGARFFILTARRGLSPITLCGDCNSVIMCKKCGAPAVLHGGTKKTGSRHNVFLCHSCGAKRSAHETCDTCGSWNLRSYGIGTEGVEEALKKEFPKIKILRLDKDSAKTPKKAQEIIAHFYETPGVVLVGTEKAVLYLREKIDYCAVASVDSLFAIPNFTIHEKIFSLLLTLRSLARKEFIIQTRHPNQPVLIFAREGNIADFYRQEIDMREKFGYPPFHTFIKISFEGTQSAILHEIEVIKKLFRDFNLRIFPAFLATSRGKFNMHALITLPRGTWVDASLLKKLRSLPPQFKVQIDPDSLL